MARSLLPYFNQTAHGKGMEGLVNWANISSNNLLIPLFLLVFYGISIYVSTKNEYKMGGQVMLVSFLFFILAMILQLVTAFNQIIIFIFAIGIVVGVVMTIVENAK
jgi:ABC-type multidrug transport system permease subunit